MKYDIGVVGLAVMGQNLILNMNDHNLRVVAYNRSADKTEAFLNGPAKDTNITGAKAVEEMVGQLKSPRTIMLMVKAGDPVDGMIEQLMPLLEKGDIIIDGGNSNFPDTNRRTSALRERGIHFLGAGISGGEEGARHGPSIMPGGAKEAWETVKPIFQAIAAKTDSGEPCCDWVGNDGAGHFVKMVHNGIEYGDMQLISEAYHFMKEGLGLSADDMQRVFSQWNEIELDSYLIEITAKIFDYKDQDGEVLVEKILDAAGQKGTGKWTGIHSLDLGVPLTLITESVFARCLSALKTDREENAKLFEKTIPTIDTDVEEWIDSLRQALLASKVISYAQGFMLMREASEEFNWELNYGNIALMWREGCIIRSGFLANIRDAFEQNSNLAFLGTDPYFFKILKQCMPAWRKVAAKSLELGISMPCTVSALSFLDGFTTARLPANLLQAQRDFFGAHTYERLDKPRGEFFHTQWSNSEQ